MCFVSAIESSIRSTLASIENGSLILSSSEGQMSEVSIDPDMMIILSAEIDLSELEILERNYERQPNFNIRLLNKALHYKMPVEKLAFKNEDLTGKIKNGINPEIVVCRNFLNHGNLAYFATRLYSDDNGNYVEEVIGEPVKAIFTPECVRRLCLELARISIDWAFAFPPTQPSSKRVSVSES